MANLLERFGEQNGKLYNTVMTPWNFSRTPWNLLHRLGTFWIPSGVILPKVEKPLSTGLHVHIFYLAKGSSRWKGWDTLCYYLVHETFLLRCYPSDIKLTTLPSNYAVSLKIIYPLFRGKICMFFDQISLTEVFIWHAKSSINLSTAGAFIM